jgi:EmrB/QacA subfamily drug resistance transporter
MKEMIMSAASLRTETHLTPGHRTRVLVVLCVAVALVVSGVASVNVALPEIARDLGATQTDLQWIVDAYALVFAALLLPAGALGDRFGRKGVLLAGLGVLGGAYLAAVWAASPGAVIAARAVAGLGAAAIMPVTLSIITTVFPSDERDRAVAVWAGVAGAGAILGLLLSGTLLEWASWGWIAVNTVWAALALVAIAVVVPTSKDPEDAPLDPVGALLSAIGLGAVVFAIIEAPQHGWLDPVTLATLLGGIALIAGFVAWELRQSRPMLDPRLFRERGFSTGALAIALQFFSLFGFIFVVLQYLQFVLGYSPLQAALAIVPMGLMLIITSRRIAPRLARRHGPGPVIAAGLVLMGGALAVLAALDVSSSYWLLAAGLVLFGTGGGLSAPPANTAIVKRYLKPSRASPPRSTTHRASSGARSASPYSAACSPTSTHQASPRPPATSRHAPATPPANQSPSSKRPPGASVNAAPTSSPKHKRASSRDSPSPSPSAPERSWPAR